MGLELVMRLKPWKLYDNDDDDDDEDDEDDDDEFA